MIKQSRSLSSMVLGFVLGVGCASGLALAGPAPRTAVAMLLVQAQDELAAIDNLARSIPDPTLRSKLLFRTSRADGAIDQAMVEAARPGSAGPGGVVVVPGPIPPGELARILMAIDAAPFSSDKLAVLQSASVGRPFSCAQVIEVMQRMSFADDQVDAAAMLYPQVIDPHNWFTVYGALTFSSSRSELKMRTEG